MEARLGSCDTREFIMVLARELAEGMLDGGVRETERDGQGVVYEGK
jgi:hypothetical protein